MPSLTDVVYAPAITTLTITLLVMSIWMSAAKSEEVGVAVTNTPATADRKRSFDQATAPFRFVAHCNDWQLVPASSSCGLRVRIDTLPDHANQEVVLVYELLRVEDDQVIDRRTFDLTLSDSGQSDFVELAAQSPAAPGIYEIRCRLNAKPDRIWSRFQWTKDPIANTRVPLIVIKQTSTEGSASSADNANHQDQTPVLKRIRWTTLANVGRISPEDWTAPAWIPGAANRIVPNVRRVGETLSLNPWRDRRDHQPTRLAQSQSYIGALTDLVPHRPFQISIELGINAEGTRQHALQVEFSDSHRFDVISRSVELSVQQSPDVNHADSTSQWVKLLFFPKAESEFVRITNRSTEKPVVIHSVRLDKKGKALPTDDRIAVSRPVNLQVTSADCFAWLAADYDDIAERRGYARSTANLLRRFKLIQRIEDHADWLGYDRLQRVGKSTANEWFTTATADLAEWERVLLADATRSWLANQPIVDDQRQPAKPPQHTTEGLASIRWPSRLIYQYPFRYQVLQTLIDLNSPSLQVTSSKLPQWVMRRDHAVLNEYRATPRQSIPIACTINPAHQSTQLFGHTSSKRTDGQTALRMQLTVINMAPWSSVSTLQLKSQSSNAWSWMDDVSEEVEIVGTSDSDRLNVTVPPHSMANLWIDAEIPEIKSWRPAMAVPTQTLQHVKQQVSQVVARIGSLALPPDSQILSNGGFEVSGQVGIVGWMHTQYPSSAVVLDDTDAVEGKHSIRMTSNETTVDQPWLVSEPIMVPDSGRLAISMATRAISLPDSHLDSASVQPASGTLPLDARRRRQGSILQTSKQSKVADHHRIRVSLEGNRQGTPIRLATDLSVPRNGKWTPRRLVFENDQLKRGDFDSLRLTIDSLSHGRIWIDDVQLHDHFATSAERSKLQGMGFLAVQGLQRRNLKPAAKLLSNNWSLHLVCSPAHSSSDAKGNPDGIDGVSSDSAADDSPNQPTDKTDLNNEVGQGESVARRLRDWLPKPIRF